MIKNVAYTFLLTIICLLAGCKNDPPEINKDFDVVVRINRDIGRINPILSSSARAREVYKYVFLNLLDYDPKTLQLSPVLAESLPQKETLDDGRVKYSFRILDDAVWDNGAPITAADFLFTLKVIHHPGLTSSNWKSLLSIIDEVIVDPDDVKVLEFVIAEQTLNTLEVLGSFEVYPEHIYDPLGSLSKISLYDIKDDAIATKLIEQDSAFSAFATSFSSSKYAMDIVEGAGAYKIKDWETDQYIRLIRKDNWWGSNYPDRTNLLANPSEIIFQIIADETTAVTQLKGGNIDVMKITNGSAFKELQSESSDILNFHKPKIKQYFFIAINNEDKLMQRKEVRQALALCIDVNKMIEVLEAGDARPISGTIDPFVEDYKSNISPISQDVNGAKKLLEENGWSDSNGNGWYDQQVDGELLDLQLNIFASSDKGENFGLLVKEFAKSIGIDVSIIRKKYSLIINEHIYKGDYQLYPFVTIWDLSPYDPYGRWHSDNIKPRGQNINRYRNKEVDTLISKISVETDLNIRMQLYADLDELISEDQPVIFLYSPLDRIVTSKDIIPLIANKRPGYFVNVFTSQEVPAFSDN